MIYLGIDCDCLDDEGLELVRQHRMGLAVILPDDLERLRAASNKERARRDEIEEVCKLAREVLVQRMAGGNLIVDVAAFVPGMFSVAEAFVAERKKREDWK